MAATRVRKMTLARDDYRALALRACGDGLNGYDSLSVYLRGALNVSDLRVRHVKDEGGESIVVYVESAGFAPNPCCWLSSAEEWLVKL